MAKQDVELKFSLIDGVSTKLTAIQKSVGSVATSISKVGVAAVATGAALAGLAIGKALVDGVKDAAAFEQSMDRIGAKAGIAQGELGALGDQIKKIALDADKTGEVGAAAFLKLIEEGNNATEALAALPTALDYVTTSTQDTAAAVGGLSDVLDSFGLGSENFARAADVITVGAGRAGTGVADLQAQLATLGPTASDVKLTLEGTAATLGVLAQNGLEGGRGAKALQQVLDQLRDPASKFREELRKIGIDSNDFNVVLAKLQQSGPKAEAAFRALGVNGTAAIKALAKDGGAAVQQLTDELAKADGATSKIAQQMRENLAGAFERARISVSNLFSKLAQPLLGPLAAELEAVSDKVAEFVASEDFRQLSLQLKQVFVEGAKAVNAFVDSIDFGDVLQDSLTVLSELADGLRLLRTVIETVRGPIKTLSDGFNSLTAPLRAVEAAADAVRAKLADIVPATQKSGDAMSLAAAGGDALAESTVAVVEEFAKFAAAFASGKVLDLVTTKQNAAATSAEAMANALAMGPPNLSATEKAAINASRGLDQLGNVIKIVDVEAEKAALRLKESTEAENARIQENIDANKRRAAAVRDVAAATDEAADAQKQYQDSLAADGGLSDAIFQGLTEGFRDVAKDLALLKGVSEDAIKRGLNADIQGSVNGLGGAASAIADAREQIEKLGGQAAVDELREDAEAAAEAVEKIGDKAIESAAKLRSLRDNLRDAADQRAGNQEAIEKRRFEEQLREINELAQSANRVDRQLAEEVRKLAAAEHAARLKEIQAEGRARVEAETGADREIADSRVRSSGGLGPSSTTSQGGGQAPGGITVNVTQNINTVTAAGMEDAARKLIPVINRLRDR
jgi:TP901 family phage tail tape measure protein